MNELDKALETIEWHDYGYANGWTETPERVKKCPGAPKHPLEGKNEGRCLNRTTCPVCRYTYLVDSSD